MLFERKSGICETKVLYSLISFPVAQVMEAFPPQSKCDFIFRLFFNGDFISCNFLFICHNVILHLAM